MTNNEIVERYTLLIEIVYKRLKEENYVYAEEELNTKTISKIGAIEIGADLRRKIPFLIEKERIKVDFKSLVGEACYNYIYLGRKNLIKEDKFSIDHRTLEDLMNLINKDEIEIIKSIRKKQLHISLLALYVGYVGWLGFCKVPQITINSYLNQNFKN